MRWQESNFNHHWIRGYGFAFLPRRVAADIDAKNFVWIWLERYARVSKWNSSMSSGFWMSPDNYAFEIFAEESK